jgi:plasmid stabilization system protein ParE
MKIEYTRQPSTIADLRKIAGNSRAYGDEVAVAVDSKIRTIIARIAQHPKAAEDVAERPGMRVVPLIRYPYKIFYRVLKDRVRILHIRHMARKPWTARR